MQKFTPWFAEHILHYQYDYRIFSNGSGDTSYDWISVLIFFLAALGGAVIWTLIDTKRENYSRCYYWLTVIVRYYIALMLINYGAIKLVHAQMPPPGLTRLMQPLGEFSPMGLAWTFLGFSKEYNIFMGIVEILAGLLLFRRTVVIGALITLATSVNIMTVNYFFDVPVKMLSTALFLFSLFLLLPYLKMLYGLFFEEKYAKLPVIKRPAFNAAWKRKSIVFFKIAFLGIFAFQQFSSLLTIQKQISLFFKKSPLYGIYQINHSEGAQTTIPKDWHTIIFEYGEYATIRDQYYQPKREQVLLDTSNRSITLNRYVFDYTVLENGDINLRRELDDKTEEIKFVKRDPKKFELKKRGFNWIQEYPHNR
ncbi:hypothetical protein FAZ19_06760 [Sphingobacterium alkalisoli]|uniref:DoxX family protein n=1 Tax=Sphingobacterium alkalisoli TaxID=1874115 RepID=A0A4U0H4I4_9SPHI|nr:DoxX family protein [Sphingobacterium alkalisoli]TJY66617.1 hypothetical protein FAZ19_06760 [Sphingobacterium alkalisoli]GGH15301.1 hypothetical protein GCM10011418_16880 [Sphingobacterium alkalisoli]